MRETLCTSELCFLKMSRHHPLVLKAEFLSEQAKAALKEPPKPESQQHSWFCCVRVKTHRHTAVSLRLPVGEVADGPGQVVRGHAGRAGEAIGHPAVFVRQQAALDGHVGQRGVLRVVVECEGERGLVDGLVEAWEGLPGVDRTELSHRQVTEGKTNELCYYDHRKIILSTANIIHLEKSFILTNSKQTPTSSPGTTFTTARLNLRSDSGDDHKPQLMLLWLLLTGKS